MPSSRTNTILHEHAEFWRVMHRILALLAARSVPENEREDLAQEIMIARIRAPAVALRILARNKTADAARAFERDALGHAARPKRVGDDALLDALPDPAGTLPDPEPDETKMLHVLPLDRLTPVQRRVFVLHVDAGMTFRAIAKSERERWEREGGAREDYATSKTTAEEVYACTVPRSAREIVPQCRRERRRVAVARFAWALPPAGRAPPEGATPPAARVPPTRPVEAPPLAWHWHENGGWSCRRSEDAKPHRRSVPAHA